MESKDPIDRRIGRLLEDAGELPMPDKRGRNWAARTRESFDSGMQMLKEVGIFTDVKWEKNKHGPGDPDRGKGWVDGWLNTKISIVLPTPAPEILEQPILAITDTPPPRRARRSKPRAEEQPISGVEIRQARTTRNWHQTTLAKHLGISSPYLSQIETGAREPSPKLAKAIGEWLTA